ncbi:MAG TPA: non-homologous end-joining DNA ligase, partial [Vicinamibacterales bacterium]
MSGRSSHLAPRPSHLALRPMLATLAEVPKRQKGLLYEPKYDGIRALVELTPQPQGAAARLWSRNGNEKTAQFPSIVAALEAACVEAPVVFDGEIVALDERGRPAGFQRLQGRIHVIGSRDVERLERAQPTALILFDFLQDGSEDLCRLPLSERRARLGRVFESVFRTKPPTANTSKSRRSTKASRGTVLRMEDTIRLSDQVADDGRNLYARAVKEHWEGLIVKDARSTYQPGRRSPAWRKLKIVHEQEFVVAGWTEPRETRAYFGALLLGVYEGGRLVHVGHTGTGFDQKELARVWTLLKARETPTTPFSQRITTNEPAHWVRPDLVAEVKFSEWTADRKLRHPVYLGLREDKRAEEVVREGAGGSGAAGAGAGAGGAKGAYRAARACGAKGPRGARASAAGVLDAVIAQLRALEDARRDGELTLP